MAGTAQGTSGWARKIVVIIKLKLIDDGKEVILDTIYGKKPCSEWLEQLGGIEDE